VKVNDKKSRTLTDTEYENLVKLRNKYKTDVDAAVEIGIDRSSLFRVLMIRSASPKTVNKIIKAIDSKL
jgi:hypothetical protein